MNTVLSGVGRQNLLVLTFSLVAGGLVMPSTPLHSADKEIAFTDDFSDVKGRATTVTNGAVDVVGGDATRELFAFMGEPSSGTLRIVAREDIKTVGPDKHPGVLSFTIDSVPAESEFCGLVYVGRAAEDKRIALPLLKNGATRNHLKQIGIRFKYKATNPVKASDAGADYNMRFEAEVELPYERRIDFGTLSATTEWKTFESTLDKGDNTYEFLAAVSGKSPTQFKLVWAQEGAITAYQPGDTLLIDDIEISIVKP